MSRGETPEISDDALAARLKQAAREAGFGLAGIAPAAAPIGWERLDAWLAAGHAGEMQYLANRADAYRHPEHVLSSVQSVLMLGMHYRTEEPPPLAAGEGRVSRYAWGPGDYHDLLRQRMKPVANVLHDARPGCRTRGIVDTAPLLEREFGRLAGLGWFGKNTMLINKHAGSYFFLCAILTDVPLPADAPHATDHCGTCTRCLEVCPTDAFPEPGVLDARRCVSYLTIELRDQLVPEDLRNGMGEWLFGCDLCQEVCPWNRKAPPSSEPVFQPAADLRPAAAGALLSLTEDQFRARFRGTPLERPGRAGLLRNAAIVLGNSGDPQALPALRAVLDDPEPLIRGTAAWAIGQLGTTREATELQSRLAVENNADVRRELLGALDHLEQRETGTDADSD